MAINFNIKIQKKDLWLLAAIFVFLAGVTYVIAWGSGNPSVMGHSYNELQTCANGQILKVVGGSWTCAADVSGDQYSGCSWVTTKCATPGPGYFGYICPDGGVLKGIRFRDTSGNCANDLVAGVDGDGASKRYVEVYCCDKIA